jgi:hypothetical protein
LIAPTVLSQLGGDKDGLMKKFSKWHWLGWVEEDMRWWPHLHNMLNGRHSHPKLMVLIMRWCNYKKHCCFVTELLDHDNHNWAYNRWWTPRMVGKFPFHYLFIYLFIFEMGGGADRGVATLVIIGTSSVATLALGS